MSMTDPIADMLTRIRNACGSKHRRVDMPVSKMKTEIARILKENNFIQDYRELESEDGQQRAARACCKYARAASRSSASCKRVSTPGLRKYVGVARDSARAQRTRHGDPEHVAGAHVRPRGAPGAHRAASSSPSSGKESDHVTNRKDAGPGPERRHGHARRQRVTVKGPKGELTRTLHRGHGGRARERQGDRRRARRTRTQHKALHGLSRTLIANMVEGVTKGYHEAARDHGRRLQGRGEAVRPAARRSASRTRSSIKAPAGHQADGAAADAGRRRRRGQGNGRPGRGGDPLPASSPSHTRGRASSTRAKQSAVRPARREASNAQDRQSRRPTRSAARAVTSACASTWRARRSVRAWWCSARSSTSTRSSWTTTRAARC